MSTAPVLNTAARRRLSIYGWAIATALTALIVLIAAMPGNPTDAGGTGKGGDFTTFYAAGSIVMDGHGSGSLYDEATQRSYEAPWVGPDETFLPFSYPPQFAAVYAPISVLPYTAAAGVGSLLMLGAVVGGLWLVRPMVPFVSRWFSLTLVAALLFFPLSWSVVVGQNVALTLLLLAWVWRSLHDGDETWAGVAVGLLMFRPQYAVPLVGLLFLGRHFRAVGAAVAVTAGFGVFNTALFGFGWLNDWAGFAGVFVSGDGIDRSVYLVNPTGFWQAVLGGESTVALLLGTAISVTAAAVLSFLWFRRDVPLDLLMAATTAGLVLISFHSGLFETSLGLIWLLVAVNRRPSRRWLVPAALVSGFLVVWVAGRFFGGDPGGPIMLVVFVAALETIRLNRTVDVNQPAAINTEVLL